MHLLLHIVSTIEAIPFDVTASDVDVRWLVTWYQSMLWVSSVCQASATDSLSWWDESASFGLIWTSTSASSTFFFLTQVCHVAF